MQINTQPAAAAQLARNIRHPKGDARRLERFLTQPFVTTEQFTGMSGRVVDLEEAISGCERILNDEFAEYPEASLYMIGKIDEAKKAK